MFYEELERPGVLVSAEGPGTNPQWIRGTTVLAFQANKSAGPKALEEESGSAPPTICQGGP